MALTRDQKYALAYTDWAAGAASIGTGLLSFVIGGAASLALYHTQGWSASIKADFIPSQSNDQGVLHNALCSNYIASGISGVTYQDVINMSVKVRPDLSEQIRRIPEDEFNKQVESALSLDLTTPEKQMEYLNSLVKLEPQDATIVADTFKNLSTISDSREWEASVNRLIDQTRNFKLSQGDKEALIGSFQILRSSFVLWSEGK